MDFIHQNLKNEEAVGQNRWVLDFIHQNLKNEEAVIQSHWVYGLYPSESEE
jgi:hypothetical protein